MDGWGVYGSASEHKRYIEKYRLPARKRRCSCGCEQKPTHLGMANGVALIAGCELSVRRWVRDGSKK